MISADPKHLYESLLLFLEKQNWAKHNTNYQNIKIYKKEDLSDASIILTDTSDISDFENRMWESIELLSRIYEKDKNEFINSLLAFEIDIHNYRISGKYINSVPIELAENILSSTKGLLLTAAQREFEAMRKTFDKKKELKSVVVEKYLQECKFGHTRKGSFIFSIEAPLHIKSYGLFKDSEPTYERRISERIYKGIRILKNAEIQESENYIVDHAKDGFDGKMLNKILEIAEFVDRQSIEYSTTWAPAIEIDISFLEQPIIELNKKMFRYVEKAAIQLNYDESMYETIFMGFPEGLSSSQELVLDKKQFGDRKIKVKGYSTITNKATLSFTVNYDNYQTAITAHENGVDLFIKCKIKKALRGWEVVELIDLKLTPT